MALPLAQAREMCGLLPKLSAVVNRPRRLELVHERHA
jgi:hypothetical protein